LLKDDEIPVGKLAYFRERLKNRLHELIFLEFLRQEDTYGLTKAELGRRIGKPPERITRLLSAPGNWTLETVSDLLLGMASELDFSAALLVNKIVGQKVSSETGAGDVSKQERPALSISTSSQRPSPAQPNPVSGLAMATGGIPSQR
jgi:hypothetical protein